MQIHQPHKIRGAQSDPKRDAGDPKRDAGDPKRDAGDPKKGAGNAGCAVHPQSVCKGRKHTVVTTGSPVSSGIPCTMVLTAYSALPGDEFVLSPSSAD